MDLDFGTIHLHLSNLIILLAVLGMIIAAWWTVKQAQVAKQRPSSGLHAFQEPPKRW